VICNPQIPNSEQVLLSVVKGCAVFAAALSGAAGKPGRTGNLIAGGKKQT